MQTTVKSNPGLNLNALGQAVDTTFGRSSTLKSSSYSVKSSIVSVDMIKLTFAAIVTFASEVEKRATKQRYEEESGSVMNDVLKKIKEEYKQLSGKAVSFKQVGEGDITLEMLSVSTVSSKKTVYFKKSVLFKAT